MVGWYACKRIAVMCQSFRRLESASMSLGSSSRGVDSPVNVSGHTKGLAFITYGDIVAYTEASAVIWSSRPTCRVNSISCGGEDSESGATPSPNRTSMGHTPLKSRFNFDRLVCDASRTSCPLLPFERPNSDGPIEKAFGCPTPESAPSASL